MTTQDPAPQGGTYITGPRQWLRKASLIVADQAGDALDLSELRISFKVTQAEIQTPNAAVIKVYNPFRDTALKVEKEFTRVILQAGYEGGNYGVIFEGQIKQMRYGRDNATTTYMELSAADGDEAYNGAIVNITLAAGSTPLDMIRAAAAAMAPMRVSLGAIPDNLPTTRLPRAVSFMCMARDVLRHIAIWSGANWSIINGVITFVPVNGYVEGEAIVLTAYTGMIGMPEHTQDGIQVRCLLNPRIFPGRLIKLDNESIQRARISLAYNSDPTNRNTQRLFPKTENDGYYRVITCDWLGDTRGSEWYADLTCYSIVPSAGVPMGVPRSPAQALYSPRPAETPAPAPTPGWRAG